MAEAGIIERIKFSVAVKKIFCHPSDIKMDGATEMPNIGQGSKLCFVSVVCSTCGKRYCAIVKDGSNRIEIREIDDPIEIGQIMGEKLRDHKIIQEAIRKGEFINRINNL